MESTENIRVIGFDADDTLWANEEYFQDTEKRFTEMLSAYITPHYVARELFEIEMKNLSLYGYGVKSFMLSMIETAIRVSGGKISNEAIEKIITLGKELLDKPVELLPGVEEVLKSLKGKYRLVVVTKGDLLDQERKLKKSGLAPYFHHIEIVSEKKQEDYQKLLKHLDISPGQFLMVGNSYKSDILPVLNMGGFGCWVPYHVTWQHEQVTEHHDHPRLVSLNSVSEVLGYLT